MSDNKIHIDKPILPKEIVEAMKIIKLADWSLSEIFFNIEKDGWFPSIFNPIKEWIFDGEDVEIYDKKATDFAIAWITEEYEIEKAKEKIYIVKNYKDEYLLVKVVKVLGITDLSAGDVISNRVDKPMGQYSVLLTEEEIKSYDERYWEFAEEVQNV